MRFDVALDDLGHKSIDGAAAGGDHLKDVVAIVLLGEAAMDRLDLPANAADPVEQARLVPGCMCDGGVPPIRIDGLTISYWGMVYVSRIELTPEGPALLVSGPATARLGRARA